MSTNTVQVAFGNGYVELPSDAPLAKKAFETTSEINQIIQEVAKNSLGSPRSRSAAPLKSKDVEPLSTHSVLEREPFSPSAVLSESSETDCRPRNLFEDSGDEINDLLSGLGIDPLTEEEKNQIVLAKQSAFQYEEMSAQNLALARIAMRRNDTRLYEHAVPHLNEEHFKELESSLKFFLLTLSKTAESPPLSR